MQETEVLTHYGGFYGKYGLWQHTVEFFFAAAVFLVLFWSLLFVTYYAKWFKFEISFWFVCAKSIYFIFKPKKNADGLNMKKVQLSKAALFTLTSSKAKINVVFWKCLQFVKFLLYLPTVYCAVLSFLCWILIKGSLTNTSTIYLIFFI